MQTDPLGKARLAAEAAAAAAPAPAPTQSCSRLWLHGFAGTPQLWDPVLQALAAHGGPTHDVRPALPGHGAPLPAPPATFQHVVDMLAAQLPAQPCHLIGYSLGARLALAVALHAPTRVQLLTLVGVNPGLEDDHERELRRHSDQAWQRCLRSQGLEAFLRAWQGQALFASQAHLPPARLQEQLRWRNTLHAEQLAGALQCMGLCAMPNFWPQLRRLTMPVSLVCGGLDTKFVRLQARLTRRLAHATATLVPNVGHNVALEAPEALAQLIAAHEHRPGFASTGATPPAR